MTSVTELRRRLDKLKEKHHPPRTIVLFGSDPVPEDATEQDTIIRFDEEDRGL